MKKVIVCILGLLGLIVVKNITFAQDNPYPQYFINAFKTCKPSTLTVGPINILGMSITSEKKIVGMKNGLCSYIEVVGPAEGKSTIRCNFNQSQIDKLVKDMKNNTSEAWNEYLNNDSVCKTKLPGQN